MVYRAIDLKRDPSSQDCEVIEVYPYASKVILLGKSIPKKTSRAGLEFLQEKLGALVSGMDLYPDGLDHDGYDAVVAGYTAYLHGTGTTESIGSPDEVPIIVPSQPYSGPSGAHRPTVLRTRAFVKSRGLFFDQLRACTECTEVTNGGQDFTFVVSLSNHRLRREIRLREGPAPVPLALRGRALAGKIRVRWGFV